MEIKQHLKLSQQLVMTPQLQQAIKLLQLSRMELVDMVRDEMLENPILEDSVESGNEQAKAEAPLQADAPGGDVERGGETETPMTEVTTERVDTGEVKADDRSGVPGSRSRWPCRRCGGVESQPVSAPTRVR